MSIAFFATIMPVWEQLSRNWAEMVRTANAAVFAWAHNGVNKNGWVELRENGLLISSWCEGTWKVNAEDPDLVEMNFGSSSHICRYRAGGFVVEHKFLLKSGKCNYRPGQTRTCGWVQPDAQKSNKQLHHRKSYAVSTAFEAAANQKTGVVRKKRNDPPSDDEKPEGPSYKQEDLRFDPFFSLWAAKKSRTTPRWKELAPLTDGFAPAVAGLARAGPSGGPVRGVDAAPLSPAATSQDSESSPYGAGGQPGAPPPGDPPL